MSEASTLRDLVEPPRAGYWGMSTKTTSATFACRVVRNGDVGHDGSIDVESLPVRWFSQAEVEKAQIDHRDAVLVSSGAYTGNVGRLSGDIDSTVVISNFVRLLRANSSTTPEFLYHLARSAIAQKHVWPNAGGSAIPNLSSRFYSSVKLPERFSKQEQARIAEVLDTLDTAIHQTEAIIAKLKAVKQGLLHDLLTRGIDANGELRPPQSEAPHIYKESPLGWIPREWHAERLSELAALVTSGSRGWAAHYSDAGDLFVRSQNIRNGYLDFSDRQNVSPPMGGEGQRTRLEGLDMMITITGNSVGNVAHTPDRWAEVAYVSQHVGLVRFLEPALALWVTQFFVQGAPGNRQLLDAQYGQSKPGLSLDSLRNLCIPVPHTNERELVVDRLTRAQERVVEESEYANQLRNLKYGLMDDLLTGRVRITPLLAEAAQQEEA